jgi:subtilase family serine protease
LIRLTGVRRPHWATSVVAALAAAALTACSGGSGPAGGGSGSSPGASRSPGSASGPNVAGQGESGGGLTTAGLPSKAAQISALSSALRTLSRVHNFSPGGVDISDYQIGSLWRRGIDGAGTTVAVIEGWNDPGVAAEMARYDRLLGLPKVNLTTIYPAGPLPPKCPAGMVKLGSYGSCVAWGSEMLLDVLSVHLIAPYAKIVISATPADSEIRDDAASQVAPPEMMKAVEYIAERHLANVISISDGTGESSYSHGPPEILAQVPGELTAAAAGIPVLVGTGDCGVVQNLPVASGQCYDVTSYRDTAAWDDSPWVTAVGGTIPDYSPAGVRRGPDAVWGTGSVGEGAGFSKIFRRPGYQDDVARITGSKWRSVPDLTMDSTDGTSESTPLLAGLLALATQLNNGNAGPINPVLYGVLGPAGLRDGIVDVTRGNNRSVLPGGKVVPGFAAAKGFDVASGWGTIDAARFVPSLVEATKAAGQDAAVRKQAQTELTRLEHGIRLSAPAIAPGSSARLSAGDFLPGHPVRLRIDGRLVATLTADDRGDVSYVLRPAGLRLPAGQHTVTLTSMLLAESASFRSN